MSASSQPVVVIGAGPAGLTAAFDLTRRGVPTVVFDQDDQVGGLAKTVVYKGFRFDIGGHRFFTKVSSVRNLWHELLGDDLQPLRPPPVRDVLQGLHRKSVGDAVQRDWRRVGGAAHQGPVTVDRGAQYARRQR